MGQTEGQVSVEVAALQYPGIDEAVYRIDVYKSSGLLILSDVAKSEEHGTGDGRVVFVARCYGDPEIKMDS